MIAVFVWTLASPAGALMGVCAGDCGDDGAVTVDELVVAVHIALGGVSLQRCVPVDANDDGEVTIDEIVGAVDFSVRGCPRQVEPRLITLSREGRIASLDLSSPWTVQATSDLGASIASARCRDGFCLVVHPAPTNSIRVVDAEDLSLIDTVELGARADPRDVALVGGSTAVVSQYGRAELLELDLSTGNSVPIDLSELADDDGLPEASRMASCGRRVFVQLQRVDHATGEPAAAGAALAVIDLNRPPGDRVVDADANTAGIQGIPLAGRPAFDMPVDCDAGVLHLAEPSPLLHGGDGGRYEQVDLDKLTVREFPLAMGADVGGFEVVEPDLFWVISHTEFGPGLSSHLTFRTDVEILDHPHTTFANEHVDDLALDRDLDLLFYPDPCTPGPSNPICDIGVHVYHARTGERLSAEAIDPGFSPIEVVVSR
jgi:hypothetical protein